MKNFLLAATFLTSPALADTIIMSPTAEPYGTQVISKFWIHPDIKISNDFTDFCNGSATAMLSFKPLTNCPIQYQQYILGYDIITLSVTYRNDYINPLIITKDQLKTILTNNTTWWDQLSPNLPHTIIEIYASNNMVAALSDIVPIANNSIIQMPNENEYIISKITISNDGIAVLPYKDTMNNLDRIRPIVVDAPASNNNIINKTYPLMRPLSLYVSTNFRYPALITEFQKADFNLLKGN